MINMHFVKVSSLIIIIIFGTYGAQSKILGAIGKFMPSVTELGFVGNAINIYFQAGQLVRSTAKLVESFMMVKQSLTTMKNRAEAIYDKIHNMSIDPYNMDTWAQATNDLLTINRYDRADLIDDFNMFEYYTVGATERYLNDMEKVGDIGKISPQENIINRAKTMNKYFVGNMSAYKSFGTVHKDYKNKTLIDLKTRHAQLAALCTGGDDFSCIEADKIQKDIAILEENTNTSGLSQEEQIINQASVIIAENMARMEYILKQVSSLDERANDLRISWERLCRGKVNVTPRKVIEDEIRHIDQAHLYTAASYDISDPDKVPDPQDVVQEEISASSSNNGATLRDANQEDILALQNAIGYIELRELVLLRDLEIMKCQTMAYANAMKAFEMDKQMEYIRDYSAKSLMLSTAIYE
jgi:hypothetical protein